MRLIRKFLIKYSTDLINLFSLNFFAWYAWRRLPELVIRSDGFVYMLERTQKWFWSLPYFYTGFETSAVLFGNIFVHLFRFHISWYFWTELIVMFIINSLFYVLIRVIMKNRIIAFTIALMFATNYFGNWGMYTDHCYCFFLERIINTILLIPSFIFLHLYLERTNVKSLLASLVLYFFGIGLAHFSLFLTPLFALYPIFWGFFGENPKISLKKGILVGFSYLLIGVFFVVIQRLMYPQIGPTWTFFQFIRDPSQRYVEKIIRQLTHWSQYPDIIRNWTPRLYQSFRNVSGAIELMPYVLGLYGVVATIIFVKLPKFRALLFTTIGATASMFLLNAYFNQYDVLNQPGANRYLYFPTYPLVLFWGLFLYILYRSKRSFIKVTAVLMVIVYYWVNFLLISGHLSDVIRQNRSTKALFTYVIQSRDKLEPQTLVVAPYPEFWVQEADFFTQTLGSGNVEYVSDSPIYADWRSKISNYQHVIKISYNKRCNCIVKTKIK